MLGNRPRRARRLRVLMSSALKNLDDAAKAFEAKTITVHNKPTRVTIETTAICNLRCVMCPHSIDAVQRPKHLSVEMFDSVRETLPSARWIQLNGIGEPLTSPSLWLALEDPDISEDTEIIFNTNMTILNQKRIDRLLAVKAKLILNVSLDSPNPLTYRRIRGAPFEEAIDNLKALIAARGDRPYPRLMLNMTLMRENIEEIVDFVDMVKALGADEAVFWHLNQMSEEEMAKYRQSRDNWEFDYAAQGLWNHPGLSNRMIRAAIERGKALGVPVSFDESKKIFFETEEETVAAPEPAPPERLETVRDCTHPWDSFLVSSSGEARVCCYAHPVGNIQDSSFEELWNGEKFQGLRRDLSANVVNEMCRTGACKYVINTRAAEAAASQSTEGAVEAPVSPAAQSRVSTVWRKLTSLVHRG